MTEDLTKKDKVMISLLGRLVFPEEKLKDIIMKNKRNPESYLRGYNSCDGKNMITEIAKIIGVNQSTLTPILKDWETRGIIFEVESSKGKTYASLYKLSGVKEAKSPGEKISPATVENVVPNTGAGEIQNE